MIEFEYAKERFPKQKIPKLMIRINKAFQILERINNNAYKEDLLGECGVGATFNIFLSLFCVGDDSRSTYFEEREDNEIQITPNDQLEILVGLITRSGAKKLKDIFNELI